MVFGVLGLLVSAVSFLVLDGWFAVISCCLGWVMLAITLSDARRFIIPDILSLPMIPAGLLATGITAQGGHLQILSHLAAAALAAGILWLIGRGYVTLRGREGLGLGDVKLAAVAGGWAGPEGVVHILLLASSTALAFTLVYGFVSERGLRPDMALPFGSFLAPAIWLVWVAQTALGI